MIEFRRQDLNQVKLNDLLSIKIDKVISDYISDSVKRGAQVSHQSVEDLKKFLSNSEFLSFSNDGCLDFYGAKSAALTIDDLISNNTFDEESGVYHICYDAHRDFYGAECRLLGIYSSLSAVQSQIERIKTGKDKSKVIDIDELDIKFVTLDDMIDVYLDGYIE